MLVRFGFAGDDPARCARQRRCRRRRRQAVWRCSARRRACAAKRRRRRRRSHCPLGCDARRREEPVLRHVTPSVAVGRKGERLTPSDAAVVSHALERGRVDPSGAGAAWPPRLPASWSALAFQIASAALPDPAMAQSAAAEALRVRRDPALQDDFRAGVVRRSAVARACRLARRADRSCGANRSHRRRRARGHDRRVQNRPRGAGRRFGHSSRRMSRSLHFIVWLWRGCSRGAPLTAGFSGRLGRSLTMLAPKLLDEAARRA